MKMKSIFSSLNAKLALAVLAVGTMFASCYDSENGDVTVTPKPDPAKYVIAGNLTDAATSAAVSPATTTVVVTIDGTEVTVNNDGYFVKEDGLASGSHVVKVSASGYDDAVRTIYLPEAADGGISYGNADFLLYGIGEDDLLEEDTPAVDATQEQAQKLADAVLADITEDVAGLGLSNVELVADASGNITMTADGTLAETPAVGAGVPVQLPKYTGFDSDVAPEANDLWTKAIYQGQIWNASASRDLAMPYGMTLGTVDYTLQGVAGKTIIGYTVTVKFESKVLSYNDHEGTVMYQVGAATASVDYESHDSHDSHNNHGSSNGAGGGSSLAD